MNIKENALKYILNINKLLNSEGISSTEISEREYNYEISVSLNNSKFKIQVYFGKKGLKTVIQGDSSSQYYIELQNLIFEQPALSFSKTDLIEPDSYIGSDECGKGDFFGPLVIAAVYVDKMTKDKLKQIGVRDSKDLSETQIADISSKIKKNIGDNFEIVKINPAKYNQLYEKFNNLNKLLNWAHSKAVDSILQKTNCKTVITDKFSNAELTTASKIDRSNVDFIQEHRAEKYVGVAAASILARHEFNSWFINQKKMGYNFPKGASDAVTNAAYQLSKSIPANEMSDYVKIHFKTFKKIIPHGG